MKLAIIGSAAHLYQVPPTGYHLVLAQHSNDADYMEFYHQRRLNGDFIIVDNGAAELQHSIPFEQVMEVAEYLEADEVVLPDVLDDMNATLDATAAALPFVDPRRRMAVPQGRSWEEWLRCLNIMVEMDIRTIGIAKRYEAFMGGRRHAVELIYHDGLQKTHNIHLLGVYNNPIREVQACMGGARGIDTAAPFAYAQQHVYIGAGYHVSYEWDDPYDRTQFVENLRALAKACHGG